MAIEDPILRAHFQKLEGTQGDTGLTSAPTYVSPEAREMGQISRPDRVIPLPGRFKQFKVRLWVLHDGEVFAAKVAAHEYLDTVFKGRDGALRLAADPSLLLEEQDRQKLALAARRFDKPTEPVFTAHEIRYLFTPDERLLLLEQLADFTRTEYPLFTAKSAEEVKALVGEYAGGEEGSRSDFLTYCEPDTLRDMIRELVDPSGRPPSDNSSKSSP